jgi:hypothetical protein
LKILQRLPPLNQSQPKRPVAGIARRSGETAAFIGAPPELVVRPSPNDSEGKRFVEHGLQLRLENLEQKGNKSQ